MPQVAIDLSEKQIDFFENSNHSFNIASGPVRSGKTHVQILRAIKFLEGEATPNPLWLFPIIGRTFGTAKENIVLPMMDFYRQAGRGDQLYFDGSDKVLIYKPKGIRMPVAGGYDNRSESRIRGMTAQALLGDEWTLWPKFFSDMAIGRVSQGKRYKWFATNPDAPNHFVMKDYIQNGALDSKGIWYFGMTDNPTLSAEYRQELMSIYSGAMRERMLFGKWVIAEGVVYSGFKRDIHIVPFERLEILRPMVSRWRVGLDFGFNHPMAAVLIGEIDGKQYQFDELYCRKQVVDAKWVNDVFAPWCGRATDVMCDSARPDLISQLDNFLAKHGIHAYPAAKGAGSVLDGINFVHSLFENNQYFVGENCTNSIAERESYRWKEDRNGVLRKEEPVKENDHAMDAERYAFEDLIGAKHFGFEVF